MLLADPPAQRRRLIALIALSAGALAVIAVLFLIQLMNKPIGDDYIWLARQRAYGPGNFFLWFITDVTGRYSNAALLALSLGLFGTGAIIALPLLLTLGLLGGVITLAWIVLRERGVSSPTLAAVAIGTAFTAAALAVPSLFDGFVWFNSVSIFLASIVAIVWAAVVVLTVHRLRSEPVRLLITFLVAFFAFGFAESTTILVGAGAAVALMAAVIARRWANARLWLTVGVSAAFALIVIYLLPGTQERLAIQSGIFPETTIALVVKGALGLFSVPVVLLTSWRLALVFLVAACIGLGLLRTASTPTLIRAAVIGLTLAFVPSVLSGIVTFLTVQSAPYRAQTLPVLLSVVGLGTVIAALTIVISRRIPRVLRRPDAVAVIVVALVAVSVAGPLSSTVQAVAQRQGLVDFRDAAVFSGSARPLAPAPLLLASTEATELAYTGEQTSWFVGGMDEFYAIDAVGRGIDLRQPEGYCMTEDLSRWPDNRDLAAYYGAVTCAQQVAQ